MDALLSPGMRLMRRFGVTGKFVLIVLLLLAPLLVTVTGAWTAGSRDISFASRERDGLRLEVPLVELLAVLADQPAGSDTTPGAASAGPAGPAAPAGPAGPGDPELSSALGQVDAAEHLVGAGLDVSAGWQRLRAEIVSGSPRSLQLLQSYVEQVADASNLILDPQLDTYYVMIALVDRLPRVLVTAAAQGRAVDAVLVQTAQRLRLDLATASAASPWDGLNQAFAPAAGALSAALTPYLSPASGTARDLTTLTAAGAALADRLGSALDALLLQRQSRLAGDRLRPLLLGGLALAGAGYLALALYRSTTRDVRNVLAEITRVSSGELAGGEPLAGRDEFAQMSRALRDTSDRLTELLSALRLQATHDELTALPNRTMFLDKVGEAIGAEPGRFAVVLADLERFKDVNDSFGHGMGDRLLLQVAARVHRAAGRRNLVARIGGNEFAVLVHDAAGRADVDPVIGAVQAALAEPVDVDGRQLHVRARIGVALHATGRPGAVELLRDADVALSAAKGRDGEVVTLFEPAMHERTRDRTELSGDLVTAVARQQFSLVYQPIVDVATGVVEGVEALARWVHPTRGPVSPAVFVPLAEASGQIVGLGRWVLQESLQQLAAWHREFPDGYPLRMDVNLSPDQLVDPALPGEVLAMISRTGVDPHRVVLEITESALVRDLETVLRRLAQLSAIGVRLALDDFGTGYSSLSHLRRLPVSVLKVDKSFVDDIESPDGQAARLLQDIVGLGVGLGMEVIAEGIESPAQVPLLRAAGCHLGQGYLWARPMTADDLGRLLRSGGRLTAAPGPDDAGPRPARPTPGNTVPGPRDSAG